MRLLTVIAFIFLLVARPQFLAAQPFNVLLGPLKGYFVSNKITLNKGMNYMLFTKPKMFNRYFGVAKTMSNNIHYPDFNKEWVIMLALPETRHETGIQLVHAIRAGSVLHVYYKVKKSYPLTYTITPLELALVPKMNEIKTVMYYEGRKLMFTDKIK
jgi:hypothetical protein